MLYAGTEIIKGDGLGIVVNLGKNTVINHIMNELKAIHQI